MMPRLPAAGREVIAKLNVAAVDVCFAQVGSFRDGASTK
jgi:hypothetical protein